jgi:hypothetical protein
MEYAELGYGLDPAPPGPVRPFRDVYTEMPERFPVSGAFLPLSVARWRWTGRPELFGHLDENGDDRVDEHELARGLGRGAQLLRGDCAGPLGPKGWGGSELVFRLLDRDGDGLVSRHELAEGLGPHAVRLVHGQPAHGPVLPPGASYGWRGVGRWVSFADREDKARYMAEAARHDAEDPAVRSWARQFLRLPVEERADRVLEFVQACIRYEQDPAWYGPNRERHGVELLDSSAVGLHRAYGDCDLKARLFVALCLASGVEAKIDPVFRGDTGFPHVRAKVLRRSSETGGEGWDVADPTITNSAIGRLPRQPQTKFPPDPEPS